MSVIKDEVRIQAPAAKIYQALTSQAGYRGWWNKTGEVDEASGGTARLHFVKEGTPVNMEFRIVELTPNHRVRWSCVAHDAPPWIGTTLDWKIREAGGGALVSFEHAGWKDAAPEPVVQGWKHFLASLKSYVETGTGQPW
jgi:uncharacterized protein YndB with AHSA1/START domain